MSSPTAGGLASVEETMTEVRRNWNVMLQDQFNPIMVALEMLQGGNPSHDYETFLRLHEKLDEAMAIIVEKYYTGFNDAVSIFGGIVDNTQLSRDITKKVKEDVEEFRDQIQFKRVEIPDLWSKVQQYKGTFAVTGKLEQVQKEQTKALEFADRKFFIPAARTLMGAIYDSRYLNNTNIISTVDIVKILEANRDNMFDQIVDEVHSIVFLKDERSAQQLFSKLVEIVPEARSLPIGISKRSASFVSNVSTNVDLVLAPTEFDFDPTLNVVAYLNSLIKAAAILELSPQLLSIIGQRIVGELYQITERCLVNAEKDYQRGVGNGDDPIFVPVIKGSMDKNQQKEFDTFVPVLKNLSGDLFGRFLIVAKAIELIGKDVGQLVDASGVPIDVESFYKSCQSAIHGEVKNFVACLFHGSKNSNTRVFTSPIVAINDALKGINKRRVGLSSGTASGTSSSSTAPPLYQFINLADDKELDGIIESSQLALSRKEEMAARKLATMLAVDPFAASTMEAGHQVFARPNLQYLSIIYRPFCQFDDWIQQIISRDGILSPSMTSNGTNEGFVDSTFIETVLSEEYIPSVESYVLQELAKTFTGPEALHWQQIVPIDQTVPIGRGSNCILECVSTFIGLLCQICCVLHQIPGSQAECELQLTQLMSQFLEKCEAKFRELVTSKTEDGTLVFTAISSHFVGNGQLCDLMAQHSMFGSVNEDEDFDAILAEKEIILLEQLKNDRSLHKNEVIFDNRIIRSIAILQRSLELLPQILKDSNFAVLKSFPLHRPEFVNGDDEKGEEELFSVFFDGSNRGVVKFTNSFHSAFTNFILQVKKLARTCLFLLRIELRVHCFYYLDLAYREGLYDFDEATFEPDPYVSTLANDLIKFESIVAQWLPYSRYHIVMDELQQSLASILIFNFRYIRALTPIGCQKLLMNVSTLEQVLSLISSSAATAGLETTKQFYQLAAVGPEKFIQVAPTLPIKFTMQQYQSIFDVYYRDDGIADTGLYKTYQNQLIRLKYLLEGKERNEK